MKKNMSTQVKRTQVRKLTANDLVKVTGGNDTRDCKGPGGATCIAYIVVKDPVP